MRVEILAHDRRVQQLRRIEAPASSRTSIWALPAAAAGQGRCHGADCACDEATLESPGKTRCQRQVLQNCNMPSEFTGRCSCGNLSATPNIETRGRTESLARPDRRRTQTICFTLKCRLPLPSVECEGTVVQC